MLLIFSYCSHLSISGMLYTIWLPVSLFVNYRTWIESDCVALGDFVKHGLGFSVTLYPKYKAKTPIFAVSRSQIERRWQFQRHIYVRGVLTSPSQKSSSLTFVLNCCCWLDSFRCWLFSLDFCTRYSHCCWSLVILSFTISSLPAHLRCSMRPTWTRNTNNLTITFSNYNHVN